MDGRRGVALIVVLGALSLTALLACTFATTAGLERQTSRNYLDSVRARLLAQSGIEHAIGQLRTAASRGELPAAGALTDSPGGDPFEVRVTDSNAKINANDGACLPASHPVNLNLRRILNVLGAQPGLSLPGLGDRVLDARPAGGYASAFDLPFHDRVRDFVTVRSWSDPDVAVAVPLSAEAEAAFHPFATGRARFRHGHQKNFRGEPIRTPLGVFEPGRPASGAVWGLDSLHPAWIETAPRSPVNVNEARREVLVALLVDLEGVFLLERRRDFRSTAPPSPCRSPGGAYAWTSLRHSYDAAGSDGDELGFLVRTRPFAGPGGRIVQGASAEAVADEILACRSREASPRVAGLDYAKAPWGGPFRTWPQFHRFCDALVEGGLLVDDRPEPFFDFDAAGAPVAASPVQRRIASQAMADVLKANFNPNLHLNELNPDRILFTHVDKTDLVVQSTEFCLTPMGWFDLESTGRVVRDGETIATAAVAAQVQAYDALRESVQASFAAGAFPARKRAPETNNNAGVESGPEPDNGTAPLENRAEGYLQLPTLGSNLTGAMRKPPGELWTTITDPAIYPGARPMEPGGRQLGSAIHAHFQLDHAAHHHAGRTSLTDPPDWEGFRLPQGAWQTVFNRRCIISRNWEDAGETLSPPYSPVDSGRAGSQTQRFRLVRSADRPGAPGDLRLDGAYAERHSAFGYWIDESQSFNFNEGTVAFWMKPAFTPGATGKRRTLLSVGRYHANARETLNPSPFALYLTPSGAAGAAPSYAGGLASFPPSSLAFGFGFSPATGYNWETSGEDDPAAAHAFTMTPPLDEGPLRAHEWAHVAVTWKIPRNALPPPDAVRIYVNGRPVEGAADLAHLYGPAEGQPFANTPRWATHSLQAQIEGVDGLKWCKNSIRLGGEPSKLFDLPGDAGLFPGNFSADATFDEFYVWLDRYTGTNGGLWGAQTLWERGRYYRPDDADPEDARFVSREFDLAEPGPARRPPPPAFEGPPESVPAPPRGRVIAVAWTAFGAAELSVEADGAWRGPFRDAGWSPVAAEGSRLRYAAKLLAGAAPGAALLATPVVDDVTVYFDRGGPRILSWVNR